MTKIIDLPERESWTTILENMVVGIKIKVPKDKGRKTVAPRISREIKHMHPLRRYKTDSKSDPDYMIIERKADKKAA